MTLAIEFSISSPSKRAAISRVAAMSSATPAALRPSQLMWSE